MEKNLVTLKKDLGDHLADILARIESARMDAPLSSASTQLMAASKMQSPEIISHAIKAGITLFGENRVQEAQSKWPQIKALHPEIKLHLIGHLQSNKAKEAVQLFDAVQSIDSAKLADELAKEMQKQNRILDCFIQVNTGEEEQKSGVFPKDAAVLIRHVRDELKLPLKGLMCIPPEDDYPAPHFALLRKIAIEHDLQELSMGMSGDYELAARMGSTLVRVGSALFGERISVSH
jgi:pyridoxal phosphate enzyme (YggS family)